MNAHASGRIAVFLLLVLVAALPGRAMADGAFVGMRIQGITTVVASGLGIDPPRGVIVRDVARDGPAAEAGVRAGDVLLSFNGAPITDFDALLQMVRDTASATDVPLGVWREGREISLSMTTGRWPKAWAVDQDQIAEVKGAGIKVATLTRERREKFQIRWGRTGLLITEVAEDSLSYRQGMRPGDVIEAVNQDPVWLPKQLNKKFIQARNRGRRVVVFLVDQPTGRIMLPVSVVE